MEKRPLHKSEPKPSRKESIAAKEIYIAENWDNMTVHELAQKVGRSPRWVNQIAAGIGLKSKELVYSDIPLLIRLLYETKDISYVAQLFKVSKSQIYEALLSGVLSGNLEVIA